MWQLATQYQSTTESHSAYVSLHSYTYKFSEIPVSDTTAYISLLYYLSIQILVTQTRPSSLHKTVISCMFGQATSNTSTMENNSQHYKVDAEETIPIEQFISKERRLSVHSQSPHQLQVLSLSNSLADDARVAADSGVVHTPIPLSQLLELREISINNSEKYSSVISSSRGVPRHVQEKEMEGSKGTSHEKSKIGHSDLIPRTLRDHEYTIASKLKQLFDMSPHSDKESIASDTSRDTEKDESYTKNLESDLDSTDDCESQDAEFGVYEERIDVVRAYSVQLDPYLPSAVEFDPDVKLHMYRNRRFQLYSCLFLMAALVGGVGALLGISLTKVVHPEQVPYRATLGIREAIGLFVRNNELEDTTSPYRMALDWITFKDPMAVTPEQTHFVQRYILAYLHFATSVKQPWNSGCDPVDPQTGEQADRCEWSYIVDSSRDPVNLSAHRWLSGASECDWAGIDCDESLQVRGLLLSKCRR
jgi:hypothetical protein